MSQLLSYVKFIQFIILKLEDYNLFIYFEYNNSCLKNF